MISVLLGAIGRAVALSGGSLYGHAASLPGGPGSGSSGALAMLAAITLCGVLAAMLAHAARIAASAATVPVSCLALALREKSWRVAYLPQRDPDRPGRARPRAPSAAPAAA